MDLVHRMRKAGVAAFKVDGGTIEVRFADGGDRAEYEGRIHELIAQAVDAHGHMDDAQMDALGEAARRMMAEEARERFEHDNYRSSG